MASAGPGPTIIYVDDDNCPGPGSGTEGDPFCSIQTAIDNAVDTDEIVVLPGTYFETINFFGKAITVRSSGGPAATVIDGGDTDRVVRFANGEGRDSALSGFRITHGRGDNPALGGGALIEAASPTISNCIFEENYFAQEFDLDMGGGGIANLGGSPLITDCEFRRNGVVPGPFAEGGLGGGMYSDGGDPVLVGCIFVDHQLHSDGVDDIGAAGGAYLGSSGTFIDCVFQDNVITCGKDGGSGGGVVGSGLLMINCVFDGNSAAQGGGVSGHGTFVNCLFRANEGDPNIQCVPPGLGGGFAGTGALINCTFTGNLAFLGDAIYVPFGTLFVTNCILFDNSGGSIYEDKGTAFVTYSCVVPEWNTAGGNISADPLFVDPLNGDYRLSPGSPCIDAGDNTAIPLRTLDLDGNPRLIDDLATPDTGNPPGQKPIVDMGAYEYQRKR